jgi:hypothetical protein
MGDVSEWKKAPGFTVVSDPCPYPVKATVFFKGMAVAITDEGPYVWQHGQMAWEKLTLPFSQSTFEPLDTPSS